MAIPPPTERKRTKKKTTGTAKKTLGTKGPKPKIALVEKMIRNLEEKLESKEIKASLGDFIRLLQLQKELQEELPKEIKVTWVEPREKESCTET